MSETLRRRIGAPCQVKSAEGPSDWLDRIFLAAILAFAAAHLILFFYYFLAVMIRQPYLDMFHYVLDYLDYPRTGGFLQYLWSQYLYSEHRQIWMRLLTAIDVGIFHGTAYPFLIFDTIAVGALPLLFGREIARTGLPGILAVTVTWAAFVLTLTTANVADCSIPIEGIYPQTVLFVVLSLVLFDGSEHHGPKAILRRLGAMISGVCAGFASAVGLLVWPLLVWAAWRGSLGWRWIVSAAVIGAIYIACYTHGLVLFGLHDVMAGDHQFYSPAHLLRVAEALITFLGLPWTRAPTLAVIGRATGAVLLSVGLFAVARCGLPGTRCDRLQRIAVGLILFSLATALFTSVGRMGLQWQGVWPIRYSLFLVPLQVGLLWISLPWMENRWANRHGRRVVQFAALSFGALMLVQQFAAGEAGARESQALRTAIADLMATGREPAIREVLWDDLAKTQHVIDQMRCRHLYLGLDQQIAGSSLPNCGFAAAVGASP